MRDGIGIYILREGQPVPANDANEWAQWCLTHRAERLVAEEWVGEALVCTSFLGIDVNLLGAIPILWETVVWGGKYDKYVRRCASRKEAERGHRETVRMLRRGDVGE